MNSFNSIYKAISQPDVSPNQLVKCINDAENSFKTAQVAKPWQMRIDLSSSSTKTVPTSHNRTPFIRAFITSLTKRFIQSPFRVCKVIIKSLRKRFLHPSTHIKSKNQKKQLIETVDKIDAEKRECNQISDEIIDRLNQLKNTIDYIVNPYFSDQNNIVPNYDIALSELQKNQITEVYRSLELGKKIDHLQFAEETLNKYIEKFTPIATHVIGQLKKSKLHSEQVIKKMQSNPVRDKNRFLKHEQNIATCNDKIKKLESMLKNPSCLQQ